MAKNITIREGDTSKQFTAKKLKTNLVGGGTTNWVPEDEAIDYVKLVDKEFKANGTYNPSDFNADGFGQVKVNIPAEVKPKTITANGEYDAADDNVAGYSKVTVAVPDGGGGGPFTVRFFDDDRQTILKTDAAVPYGGTATCDMLEGTVVGGQYFKGWNPNPVGVKESMNCYPVRNEYVIDPNEIQDTWETICVKNGADYPLGSYKALVIPQMTDDGKFVDYLGNEHIQRFETNFHMVKVADGEQGSTSTWLATGAIYLNPNDYFKSITQSGGWGGYQYATTNGGYGNELRTCGWRRCDMRHFLNQAFLRNLPLPLFESIKSVTKYSRDRESDDSNTLNNDMETFDKIWLPSERELKSIIESKIGAMIYTPAHMGIDYSLVYVGSYGYGLATRDCNSEFRTEIKYDWNNWSRSNRYWYWGNDASFVIGFCL